MAIPADKTNIQYRTALQVQSDIRIQDISVFCADLQDSIDTRKTRRIPIITKGDVETIHNLVGNFAQTFFQLHYRNEWLKLSPASREKIIQSVMRELFLLAKNPARDAGLDAALLVPSFLEQAFLNYR